MANRRQHAWEQTSTHGWENDDGDANDTCSDGSDEGEADELAMFLEDLFISKVISAKHMSDKLFRCEARCMGEGRCTWT